jgi:hypothetical protein
MASPNVIEVIIKATDQFTAEFKKASQAGQQMEKDLGGSFMKVAAVMTAASAAIGLTLRKTINDATNWGGSIAEMSTKTGMAAETLSGLAYAANRLGFDLEGLQLGFKQAAGFAYDASNGSEVAKAKFAALGITVVDEAGKLKSMDQLLPEIADGLAGIENPTKKAALASDIFGRSGMALIPVLGQGSAEFKKFQDRARELGVELTGPQAEALHEYEIAVKDWHMGLLGIKIAVTEALLPVLKSLVDYVTNIAIQIREWVKVNPELAKQIGEVALAIMGTAGLLAALTALVSIAPAVKTAWVLMAGPVGVALAAIGVTAAAVKASWEDFLGTSMATTEDETRLLGAFNDSLKAVGTTAKKTGGEVSDFLGAVRADLIALQNEMIKTSTGKETGPKPVPYVSSFVGPTTENEPQAIPEPEGGWITLTDETTGTPAKITTMWQDAGLTMGNIARDMAGSVGEAFGSMLSSGDNMAKSLIANFKKLAIEIAVAVVKMLALKAIATALHIPVMMSGGGEVGGAAYAQFGGMVHGPAGVDRVPIMATAGEFIIPKPLVDLIRRGSGQAGGGNTIVNNTYNIEGNLDAYTFREWVRYGDGARVLRAAGLA